jgi:hypothetical protein
VGGGHCLLLELGKDQNKVCTNLGVLQRQQHLQHLWKMITIPLFLETEDDNNSLVSGDGADKGIPPASRISSMAAVAVLK